MIHHHFHVNIRRRRPYPRCVRRQTGEHTQKSITQSCVLVALLVDQHTRGNSSDRGRIRFGDMFRLPTASWIGYTLDGGVARNWDPPRVQDCFADREVLQRPRTRHARIQAGVRTGALTSNVRRRAGPQTLGGSARSRFRHQLGRSITMLRTSRRRPGFGLNIARRFSTRSSLCQEALRIGYVPGTALLTYRLQRSRLLGSPHTMPF